MNKNTVKLSYKCMPNIKRQISRHNGKILQEDIQPADLPACNCRGRPCPLDGKCLSAKSVIYRAKVVDENQNTGAYTGLKKKKH